MPFEWNTTLNEQLCRTQNRCWCPGCHNEHLQLWLSDQTLHGWQTAHGCLRWIGSPKSSLDKGAMHGAHHLTVVPEIQGHPKVFFYSTVPWWTNRWLRWLQALSNSMTKKCKLESDQVENSEDQQHQTGDRALWGTDNDPTMTLKVLSLDVCHYYQKHAIQDEHMAVPLTTNGVFQVVTCTLQTWDGPDCWSSTKSQLQAGKQQNMTLEAWCMQARNCLGLTLIN